MESEPSGSLPRLNRVNLPARDPVAFARGKRVFPRPKPGKATSEDRAR